MSDDHAVRHNDWLAPFESLGTNCEFGFVQRALGYERSSLLRWAYISDIEALCAAVESRFEGVFAFENLRPAGEGTMVEDSTLRIAFHSEMRSVLEDGVWTFSLPEAERYTIYKKEREKISYLLDKFERDIAGSERIYVLKRSEGLSHRDAWRVLDVITKRGGGRLLYVLKAPVAALTGTVERINARLMVGWVDRLSPISQANDISLDCWIMVLRAALKEFSSDAYRTDKFFEGKIGNKVYDIDERSTEGRLLSALTLYAKPGQTNLLFDPALYAERYFIATGLRPFGSDEALLHWVQEGRHLHIVPNFFFDENYYLKTQNDVKNAGFFGFEHFLLYGMAEGRPPTKWFRQDEYAYYIDPSEAVDYSHFLHFGAESGVLPSDDVRVLMQVIAPNESFTLEIYKNLIILDQMPEFEFNVEDYLKLSMLFMPKWHKLRANTSVIQSFLEYACEYLKYSISPGPLFNVDIYRSRALTAGLPLTGLVDNPILHWLHHGFQAQVVPTDRFDESFYLQNNHDIAASDEWSFIHFARHGVYEGRSGTNVGKCFALAGSLFAPKFEHLGAQQLQWFRQDFPSCDLVADSVIPERFHRRLQTVLDSDKLREIFAQAQAIDPAVGEIETLSSYLLLPYYDKLALSHSELRSRLPRNSYESVICVPWIRLGGADLVAGLLARALLRVKPTEKLLIIRTDQPHFERADWLPQEADIVDASDIFAELELPNAQHLLKVMLRGVEAKRIFNVNSRLCWTLFRDHGAFMANSFHNYAYLFCWDHMPSGLRAGYPAEFFANTIEYLSGCMTDTLYLRDQLSQMYHLPPQVKRKLKPLYTPAQSALLPVAIARQVAEQKNPDVHQRVLWGGRLDRQKRFDLVIELARLMPDIEFWCWGSALLDQGPDFSELPSNITMQGTFASFDDVPLASAALWLFTALWEGMPTTIIELATRGVGVVASAVGGVPELITSETGWPVAENATVEIYEQIIRSALADPQEVACRAEALQDRVAHLYNNNRYDADIAAMLGEEDA